MADNLAKIISIEPNNYVIAVKASGHENYTVLTPSRPEDTIAFGAEVAQLVEQRTENPRVTSPILVLGTCHL